MKAYCISAIASNQGKTILTTALLWHFRNRVRPFKIGPDFIDPQFHTYVCGTPSVNLDTFIMDESQVTWLYAQYATEEVAVLEGVMGFYDGEDKGCSAYSVSRLLGIPTILVLDGSGSYITVSAVLKGLCTYTDDHTIQAVVLNNLSSQMHYALIKKQIETDHPEIHVLGWIEKHLPSLGNTHLGLNLRDLDKIAQISQEVLKHIDLDTLETLDYHPVQAPKHYPFPAYQRYQKTIAVVQDENFSFLYHDNLRFLQEQFEELIMIDATQDEPIPLNVDLVYLPGGYVESDDAYARIKDATRFRQSLITHAQTKAVYAECAGLLYLGRCVDDKEMSGILDIEFTLDTRFNRLGYYYSQSGIKGHAFHYTKATEATLEKGFDILSKTPQGKGRAGSWKKHRTYGTYLHTMFRAYPQCLNMAGI